MRLCAFLVAFVLLAGTPAMAAELPVKNMAFQEWDAGQGMPAQWTTGAKPGSYAFERDCALSGDGRCVLRVTRAVADGFVPLVQSISAGAFDGGAARLSGRIRTRDVSGWAGLWVRVDASASMISLDNMADRGPRGTSDWKRFEIVLPVPRDATRVVFGVLMAGSGTAWFDDLRMDVAPAGAMAAVSEESGRPIPDAKEFGAIQLDAAMAFARLAAAVRFFHPGDAAQKVNWDRFLIAGSARMLAVSDRAGIGPELERLFSPWAAGIQIADSAAKLREPSPVAESEAVQWVHVGYGKGLRPQETYYSGRSHRDGAKSMEPELERALGSRPSSARIDLGAGWWASVPLKLSSQAASVTPAQEQSLAEMERGFFAERGEPARAQSIAAGIALWGYARNFYPYWGDVKADWDATLRDWLAAQPPRQSRAQLVDQLSRLTAGMSDGHAFVSDQRFHGQTAFLPIGFRRIGERWVVDASSIPQVRPGDEIVTIDGRDARQVMEERIAAVSGSPQWRASRAALEITRGEKDSSVSLGIDRGGTRVAADVKRSASVQARAPRPGSPSELRDGIWYLDVSRFDSKSFQEALPRMASAKAVIFDLRGYPSSAAYGLAAYWIREPDSKKWMFVPMMTVPSAPPAQFRGVGWNVEPRPELRAPRKFLLTDAHAISFSESLTGYFASQHQGTIVGEPTAGANGNVLAVGLPGAYRVSMTGMRVTRHDGSVMHAVGFAPDVAVSPTVEGLRAGRDEILERAIELADGNQ